MASRKREQKKRERARRTRSSKPLAKGSTRPAPRQLLEKATEQAGQTAKDYIQRDDLPTRTIALADETRKIALRVIRQSPLDGKHECKPGCAFCCHTSVTVAAVEAFAIAQYLQDHYSPDELDEVRRRMEENAALASSMTRDEYIAKLIPCALMTEDGHCRVHPVRPIACAGFLSTSRAKCEAEFKRTAKRDPVPTDKFAMLAGLAASNGLMEACKQANLDGDFYELHHALGRVMDDPEAGEKWANGKTVFDGCLR